MKIVQNLKGKLKIECETRKSAVEYNIYELRCDFVLQEGSKTSGTQLLNFI